MSQPPTVMVFNAEAAALAGALLGVLIDKGILTWRDVDNVVARARELMEESAEVVRLRTIIRRPE